MTIKDRLIVFSESVKDVTGGGRNKFEDYVGLGGGGLSKRTAVKSDTIEKVKAKFPELNLEWLFTGVGNMTNSESETTNEEIVRLYRKNEKLSDEISDLKNQLIKLKDENAALEKRLNSLPQSETKIETKTNADIAQKL